MSLPVTSNFGNAKLRHGPETFDSIVTGDLTVGDTNLTEVSYQTRQRASAQSIPDSTATDITWSEAEHASGDDITYDESTGVFTINKTGMYEITYNVSLLNIAGAGSLSAYIYRESTEAGANQHGRRQTETAGGGVDIVIGGSTFNNLYATDTVRLRVEQTTGAAVDVGGASLAELCQVSVRYCPLYPATQHGS